MAFTNKTDLVGLATTGLELRSNSDGASNQNLEITGSNGSILGNEKFGSIKAPTCEYVITKAISFSGKKLGEAYDTVGKFALQSLTISTSAGGEPTVSASAVEIETNTDKKTYCTYTIDTLALTPARHANAFGALGQYTESATLALQSATFTASAEISPSTINGLPVASDAVKGKEEVSVTFWTNSDSAAPAVTAATGWVQTADWACTGADGALFSWTATFTKYLTATAPTV